MATDAAGLQYDLRERLQAALGGAYTLERELGGGGMARVFVAHDVRLGRRVVVKVLHPDLAAGLSARRFEREIALAARLQHPHVVPLLAAGEVDGLPYYTMPYVAGESLHERLGREGALPVAEAVRLVRELADALAYAHREGVVHRDLKPRNVLLSEGHAVVADFGVAKALSAATRGGKSAAATSETTGLGVAVGTPAYMAPEQVTGEAGVDHRADLYALGVIAYELLAGTHPFAGRSPPAMLAAHLAEAPAPLAEHRPDMPPALAALVLQLLAKRAEDRPPSAETLVRLLDDATSSPASASVARDRTTRVPTTRTRRWLAGAVVGGLAVILLLGLAVARWPRTAATPAPPVLAVLPFENLGPPADAYFADGLTEEVRARLSGVAGLQVIGGRSTAQYKGSAKPPRQIARELGASHLLTATVRWERGPDGAGRVRVSPELVRATDLASVWAGPVEGPLTDAFALQARVAERVAGALDAALGAQTSAGSAAVPRTRNPEAYDAYLRGLAHGTFANRLSASSRRQAIRAFERAVALDPAFAEAHARLAMAYLIERSFGPGGTAGDQILVQARGSVARALALEPTGVEPQHALGHYRADRDDPEGTYRAFRAALRGAPGDAELHYDLGWAQSNLGRAQDAIRSFERAALLEPRWSAPVGQLGLAYAEMGRYEESLRAHDREIAITPEPFACVFRAAVVLLWRADTVATRRALSCGDSLQMTSVLTALPGAFAGRAIWLSVLPSAVLAAKDTLTLAAYLRSAGWGSPYLFHHMKARHFALTGRLDAARVHADSVITFVEPALGDGPDAGTLLEVLSKRSALAEAYAYVGRTADAARVIDRYVEDRRRERQARAGLRLPYALTTAAYVDVLIGRRDLAVARLEQAFRLPSGQWISRALLRADPSWAPLRGHPAFERLIAGS